MKEMRAKRKAQRKATQGRRRWSLVRKAALVAMAMSRVGKDVVEGSADVSLCLFSFSLSTLCVACLNQNMVCRPIRTVTHQIEHFPKYNDFKRNISIPPEARNERVRQSRWSVHV